MTEERLVLAERLDGFAVGCGGVAAFEDYAEVKRMYTRPAARGRGVAKALLYRIEDEARRANKSVLRLETGVLQRGGHRPLRDHGVSTLRPVRTRRDDASLQHRDEPLFREGALVDQERARWDGCGCARTDPPSRCLGITIVEKPDFVVIGRTECDRL
jgi:Acetyltransferase (GNAT) family